MLDVVNGSPRVRLWPKKRGKPKTPEHQAQVDFFRHASWAQKFMHPDMHKIFIEIRQGTALLPRDLAFMMFAGTIAGFVMPDGRKVLPMQLLTKVSESLDAITQTPGKFLIRGIEFWEAADAPTGVPWYWSPPDPATFTFLSGDANAMTAQYSAVRGMSADIGQPVTGDRTRCAVRSLPAPSASWTLSTRMDVLLPSANYSTVGIVLRDSVSGRLILFGISQANELVAYRLGSLTNYNSNIASKSFPSLASLPFLRIASDGANLAFSYSPDGLTFTQLASTTLTEWLTNKPDQIGFGGIYNRSGDIRNTLAIQQFELT